MKAIFFFAFAVLLHTSSLAQPGKKTAQKDKPPTQKEMDDMMKEMQKELDGLSPEDKKAMDSMGVKLPTTATIPKLSDKQLADAWKEEGRIVPERNAARIAAIPKTVTQAKMGAYITAIQNTLPNVLTPAAIANGNKAYESIRSNSKNLSEAGNMAIGLWIAGQAELAFYVMGKLCAADAGNMDNLSNYSAMLSMQGGQHLAIPILNLLNKKYPKNSTLLNNLGQAWFGLGEIGTAEKYLDSAIRIYAYHPQANLTKSFIEESRGNKQAAINAVKRSILKSYSLEKDSRLKKLGYKIKPEDLSWDKPVPQDPLGLEKFKWPEYPMTVEESEKLEVEWSEFKKKCSEAMQELKAREKTLEKQAEDATNARTKQLLQASQQGIRVNPLPPHAYKAMVKLDYFVNDKDGHISVAYQKKMEAITNANLEAARLAQQLSKELKSLEDKYEDQFGEGRSNPFAAACADDTKAKNLFLKSANGPLRDAFNDFLRFMRQKTNNEMYYSQYTTWPEIFELAKVQARIGWLSLIMSQTVQFRNKSGWCRDNTHEEAKPFKLANFEDFACQYQSSLNLGCVKMETNCGTTTTTYGCGGYSLSQRELGQNYTGSTIKLAPKVGVGISEGPLTVDGSIQGNFTIVLDANNDVTHWEGKINAGVEAGVGVHTGPVKAGASAYEGLEVEIGSNGVEDVNFIVGGKVEAGISAPKLEGNAEIDQQINKGIGYVNKGIGKLNTKVEVGIESRTSLLSNHGSLSTTGLGATKLAGW
jgi:hypothetical protein